MNRIKKRGYIPRMKYYTFITWIVFILLFLSGCEKNIAKTGSAGETGSAVESGTPTELPSQGSTPVLGESSEASIGESPTQAKSTTAPASTASAHASDSGALCPKGQDPCNLNGDDVVERGECCNRDQKCWDKYVLLEYGPVKKMAAQECRDVVCKDGKEECDKDGNGAFEESECCSSEEKCVNVLQVRECLGDHCPAGWKSCDFNLRDGYERDECCLNSQKCDFNEDKTGKYCTSPPQCCAYITGSRQEYDKCKKEEWEAYWAYKKLQEELSEPMDKLVDLTGKLALYKRISSMSEEEARIKGEIAKLAEAGVDYYELETHINNVRVEIAELMYGYGLDISSTDTDLVETSFKFLEDKLKKVHDYYKDFRGRCFVLWYKWTKEKAECGCNR